MQKKIFGSSNDLIGKLKEDYRYFREQELSRGYLLIGKPGTGKTAIVNAIVNSVDGRVFIISGLEGPGAVEELESLFVQMRPNFIIFDDCDRSQKTPTFIKAVLKMLETVKDKNPHTNFLFTANTFSGILYDEAVTRKGRIDQIYEVPDPDDADRREIFNGYAEEMSITLSDEDMQKCVTSSDGMMGADIKELCIQLQRASIDEVFERAQEVEHLRVKYSPSEILFDPDDDGSSEFLNTPRRRAKLISSLLKQAKVTGR
jgi:SpoVK/Ycf46/Vps4 family AAA+-type ATPase